MSVTKRGSSGKGRVAVKKSLAEKKRAAKRARRARRAGGLGQARSGMRQLDMKLRRRPWWKKLLGLGRVA